MASERTFGDSTLTGTLFRAADRFDLQLKARAHGDFCCRVPLLTLEVYTKAEFRIDQFSEYRIDEIEELENGVHLSLGVASAGIRIGLWLRINRGELSISMPMAEVYEDKAATHRLFSVLLLPRLIQAANGGRMLLPLNTGILCDPSDKPALSDRFMIYGEQPRWELMPTLPICAANSAEGGFIAMAKQAAGETECMVETDGQANGYLTMGFTLRQNWPDPVSFQTREVVYQPIEAQADLLHTTAQRLRRHVIEDLGKPTLKQRAEESPQLAYWLNAYTMKVFFAVEHGGAMPTSKADDNPISFQRVMTFAQCKTLLNKIHQAGIDRSLVHCVGWNPRGHDGLWPTRWPIDDRLGGEVGFRDLIRHANHLGFQMNVHDNHRDVYPSSPDFPGDDVIHDMWLQPMGLGQWGGGIGHVLNVACRDDDWFINQMCQVKSLGLTGAAYLDAIGNPLYRDYHAKHRSTRLDYAQGIVRLIKAARHVYGAAGVECGFLYNSIDADYIVTAGEAWHMQLCRPQWPITRLMDQRVPLWQLAMHGLTMLESQGHDWPAVMRTLLLASHPRTQWSAQPGVMPVLDDRLIGRLKAIHDLVLKRFGRLQTQAIIRHERVADNTYESQFEDGTQITADFNTHELCADGESIARPDVFNEGAPEPAAAAHI